MSVEEPIKAPKRKGILALGITLGVFAVVLVGILVWFVSLDSDLDREKRLARAAGIPVTPDDLRQHPIDEANNAAPLIELGIQELDRQDKATKDFDKAGTSRTGISRDLSAGDRFLPALSRAIALFREAAQKPDIDFHRPWEKGPAVLFPEYSKIREATRIMLTDADLQARKGDLSGAFSELSDVARLARLTRREPILISGLVSIACSAMLEAELERILWRVGNRGGMYPRVRDVIAALGPPIAVRDNIRYEIVMSLQACEMAQHESANKVLGMSDDNSDESGGVSPKTKVAFLLAKVPAINREMAAHVLRDWREMYVALPVDGTKVRQSIKVMKDADVRMAKEPGVFDVLASILAPVFSGAANAFGQDISRRRTLLVLAASLDARAKGDLALRMPPLGPDTIDPFTGLPFKLKAKPGGLMVYGVGQDGVDHGGVRHKPGTSSEGADVVAEYPAP